MVVIFTSKQANKKAHPFDEIPPFKPKHQLDWPKTGGKNGPKCSGSASYCTLKSSPNHHSFSKSKKKRRENCTENSHYHYYHHRGCRFITRVRGALCACYTLDLFFALTSTKLYQQKIRSEEVALQWGFMLFHRLFFANFVFCFLSSFYHSPGRCTAAHCTVVMRCCRFAGRNNKIFIADTRATRRVVGSDRRTMTKGVRYEK